MFRTLLISLAVKALQAVLCQFFEVCKGDENCPNGVCDDAIADIQNLNDDMADPLSAKPQSLNFDIQWDQLECLVQTVRELITCIRKFLGLADRTVG